MKKKVIYLTILFAFVIFSIHGCVNRKLDNNIEKRLSPIIALQETSLKGPQFIDIDRYRLKITGTVCNQDSFSFNEIKDSNTIIQRISRLKCVEGWSARIAWEGVPIMELLNRTGIKPETKRVIFHCVDEYTTSFTLDYIREKNIIMAFRVNGIIIPDSLGFPFQLVAEGKWGYKWAKWITEIELTSDEDYRGFWEKLSLSRDADTAEHYLQEKYRKYYE